MSNSINKTKRIVLISLFSALAYICMFVFRIKVSFLTFDAKDAVITVGAMLLGAPSGIIISFITAFTEYISVSDTGIYGFIMNFASSAAFSSVAAFIYRKRKTLNTALLALMTTVASMTAVMLVLNLIVTPFYTGAKTSDIAAMILPLLLPFNFTKGLLNASLVLIIYKPIVTALRRANFTKDKESFKYNKNSILVLLIGLALLAVSIFVFVLLLNGSFEWVRQFD